MIYINFISILTAVLFVGAFIVYRMCLKSKMGGYKVPKFTNQMIVIVMFASAFIIRMIGAFKFSGHADIECFEYWATTVFDNGFGKFYEVAKFADYPPGYMYILNFLELIIRVFKLGYKTHAAGIVIKSFPILCDLITAGVFYNIAKKKKFDNIGIYVITFLYLFNPAVILNSSVWGQVDSVFFLGILLMCYYATTDKKYYAYAWYVVAILIKPQAIMFTPIIMLAFAQDVLMSSNIRKKFFEFKKDKFIIHIKWIVGSLLGFVCASAPFGFSRVVSQYGKTMGSYEYASVNAYNFWSMWGLNWTSQEGMLFGIKYSQWGTIFIMLICIFALFLWLFKWGDDRRYVMIAVFVCAAMFTMSVRMHERYIYPAVILLLLYFVLTKHIQAIVLYGLYTIAHFYNCAHVLFFYDANNFDARNAYIIIVSVIHVLIFGLLLIYIYSEFVVAKDTGKWCIDNIYKKDTLDEESISIGQRLKKQFFNNEIQRSKVLSKMTKKDFIIMFAIMIVYSVFALTDLGDKNAPQTFWENKGSNSIRIELDKETKLSKIAYYNGYHESCEYRVKISTKEFDDWEYDSQTDLEVDSKTNEEKSRYIMEQVFLWSNWPINMPAKYIEIECLESEAAIGELVLVDEAGKVIKPKNVSAGKTKVSALFDEQKVYPKESSFRNSTYFDEIYHARTAYEFIHGLYSYEWTHPPLGKWFISLGIRAFGMCPFGWRIVGTIFGILMVPAIYVFGKKLFSKTSLATLTCILFTFDFMHFAQTRIATIDVYVTMFVILMYYFMYKYYVTSFYDTKLSKTFIPLLLSGICMGLGCASKWTGCYAAVGLAIIFFSTVFKRTHEYNIAKKDIDGETNGIKHAHIVKVFKGNLIKTLLFCCLVFIIIPVIIYTLSYIPFVGGNDAPKSLIGRMLDNQVDMFTYHSNIRFEHGYSSRWYEWALMIRPIFYYTRVVSGTIREGINSFGNPLVWWLGIPAFVYIIYRVFTKKDRAALFIGVGYLAELLPWVLISRLTFIYHYFTSVPFVVFMNVFAISRLLKDNPKKMTKYICVYSVAVIVLFVMFYPVLSGQPVSINYVNTWLRWLDSWTLISG